VQRIPILTYHRVVDAVPGDDYYGNCMPRELFAAQMRTLAAAGYRTLGLEDAAALMRRRTPPPPRCVAITFDDGYLDTFEAAVPILRRFGFTATVFVVAGLVGRHSLWDAGKCCTAPLMGWPHLLRLLDWGFAIGSHTLTHPELSALPRDEARHEIVESRARLERGLGRAITSFCYPFGEWDETTYRLVRAAGYTAACNDHWRDEHRPLALARRLPSQSAHPLADPA
jgi:peptidoglycan/xylan/chitin deacetylase (PgdA/CDA1 family)